jgi:hypothetical protein
MDQDEGVLQPSSLIRIPVRPSVETMQPWCEEAVRSS